MHIGIDLDNTLIDYDAIFQRLGREAGYSGAAETDKTAVRNRTREKHGDEAWQRLQAQAYGERILEAKLFPGALDVLRALKAAGHKISIISHKTRHTDLLGTLGPDLHTWAMHFLEAQQVLELVDQVTFCSNRKEKCETVATAGCAAFVDDLPEVLEDPAFPAACRRILFGRYGADALLRTWRGLPALLLPEEHAGVALSGGRNSRVRRIEEDIVLKQYPNDGRDRCRTEWKALNWLLEQGFTCVPEPYAMDAGRQYMVMEFVDAGKPRENARAAKQMQDFALKLYALRERARGFPPAADAFFSREAIIEHLRERLLRLKKVPAITATHRAMHAFISETLEPAFAAVCARKENYPEVPELLRMPSPSDFGLHNALQRSDGRLVFLDFEYFGLDDPVKLICDVLLHPGMRLAAEHRQAFAEAMFSACEAAGDKDIRTRHQACLVLWRIKWACILLNEFIATDSERRVFSLGDNAVREERLFGQLVKSKAML